MAFDINFGAIQTVNPFREFAEGQEIAQQRRQNQARREAGNIFATDPEKAAEIFFNAGEFEKGLAVREYGEKAKAKKARAEALGMAAKGDFAGAQTAALAGDDLETYNAVSSMSKERRELAKASAEQLATVGQWVSKFPYTERRAAIQQQRQLLLDQGLTPEQIDGFDPTDQAIQGFTSQALGLKGMLEQADRDADNRRADAQLEETRRHNRAGETTAQGNLAQRRTEHSERKAQGGYSAPRILGSTLPEGY